MKKFRFLKSKKFWSIFSICAALVVAAVVPTSIILAKNAKYPFTIEYNIANIESKELKVKKGSTIQDLEIVGIEGYRFGGWFKDKNLTEPYALTDKISKNSIIYAKYNKLFNVSCVGDTNHYSIISDEMVAEEGKSYEFEIQLEEAYDESEIVVTVNGNLINPQSGIYKFNNVSSSLLIKVEGVELNVHTVSLNIDGVVTQHSFNETEQLLEKVRSVSAEITDYNSCGWFIDDKFNNALSSDIIIKDDVTVYTKTATMDKLSFIAGDGYWSVTGLSSSISGEVVIPRYYKASEGEQGLPVTKIPDNANGFKVNSNITNVVIPNTITYIGVQAFAKCETLIGINLPVGVKELGLGAFVYCYDLSSVKIPEGLEVIGDVVFGYTAITEMTFPSTLRALGVQTFYGCSNLTTVTFLAPLETIPSSTFYLCGNLSTVNISGVETVGDFAFHYCSKLEEVNFLDSVKYINSYAFQHAGLKSLSLTEGLRFIGDGAFNHCTQLQLSTIVIPSTVEQIGGETFVGDNETTKTIGTHVFYDCAVESLSRFEVASGNTHFKSVDGVLYTINNKYLVAYPAAKTDETYTILDGCEAIFECGMSRAHYLKTLRIPDGFKLEYSADYVRPENYLNTDWNSPLIEGVYLFTSIENYELYPSNENYISENGIIYTKSGTAVGSRVVAAPFRNGVTNENGKKVLEFNNNCTTIEHLFTENSTAGVSYTYNGREVGGYPDIIKIGANITTIHEMTITYINNLITNYDITVEVDSNNENYEIKDNKLVAKSV